MKREAIPLKEKTRTTQGDNYEIIRNEIDFLSYLKRQDSWKSQES
jgi:hypothetical protein